MSHSVGCLGLFLCPHRVFFPWQGRAGEPVKRQSNGVGRTGFFELLATVAGQILQDAGVEERVNTDLGDQELSKDKLQSQTHSQISSLESVMDHTFVHKPQPEPQVTSHMDASENEGTAKEEVAALANNAVESQSCEAMAWILAQEEETKAIVKDISVDESNVAPVHTTCSPLEDQVITSVMLSPFFLSFLPFGSFLFSFLSKEILLFVLYLWRSLYSGSLGFLISVTYQFLLLTFHLKLSG